MENDQNPQDPYQRDEIKPANKVNRLLAATSVLSLGTLVFTQFSSPGIAADLIDQVFSREPNSSSASSAADPQPSNVEAPPASVSNTGLTAEPGSAIFSAAELAAPAETNVFESAPIQSSPATNTVQTSPTRSLVLPDTSGLTWGEVSSATPSYQAGSGGTVNGVDYEDDDDGDDDDDDDDDHDDDDHDDDRDDD